jgi:response regulator NasT
MRKDTNLLLVDSKPETRDSVVQILSDIGFSVTATGSADDALRLKRQQEFHLVILEINHPDLTSVDLVSELLDSGTAFMFLCHSNHPTPIDINSDVATEQKSPHIISSDEIIRAVDASLSWADEFKRLKETESRYTQAIETGRVVDVVVGILMERHQLEREKAFEMLRSKARSERRKIRDLAQEILDVLNKINKIK